MFSFEEYLWGWIVYLLATLSLLLAFWRITQSIRWFYFRECLRLTVATLLLTPATIESANYFLSPAWIQGFLRLIFAGIEDFLPVGRHLLIAVCLMLFIYLVMLIALQLYRRWQATRPTSS